MSDARAALTAIAAECHRAKWQFDLSEDYKPTAAAARGLIISAFSELHRIGDIALKLRDGSLASSTTRAAIHPEQQRIADELNERQAVSLQDRGGK